VPKLADRCIGVGLEANCACECAREFEFEADGEDDAAAAAAVVARACAGEFVLRRCLAVCGVQRCETPSLLQRAHGLNEHANMRLFISK